MQLDKDKVKDNLNIEDIHKILKDLGSKEPKKDYSDNYIYSTVCHHGSSQKLYYYEESKMFHCYTHCGESFDIYSLVSKAKDITFPQAVQYIVNLTGKRFGFGKAIENIDTEKISDWNWINKFQKKDKINTELPKYDETVLDVFLPLPHESWLEEGISYDSHEKYQIGYYISQEKISIPHFDLNNRLIGIRGRATKQEDVDNGKKYMPITIQKKLYNHQLMFNLYGLNHSKEAIKRQRKVCIFEGEKSVLKADTIYGEDNFSVACCSSNITNFHRDILLSLGVEEVIICFDKYGENDSEEKIKSYQKKLLNFANKFTPYARTFIVFDDFDLLDYKQSPIDKGRKVLERLMSCKYEIATNSGV